MQTRKSEFILTFFLWNWKHAKIRLYNFDFCKRENTNFYWSFFLQTHENWGFLILIFANAKIRIFIAYSSFWKRTKIRIFNFDFRGRKIANFIDHFSFKTHENWEFLIFIYTNAKMRIFIDDISFKTRENRNF